MIRVFVVDDHHLARTGFRYTLANVAGIQIVGEAENAAVALAAIPKAQPDVVICDYDLPDRNGLHVVTSLLQQDATLKILIVSAITTAAVPRQLLRAGALGYITKARDGAVLIRGIRQIAKGAHYIDEALAGMNLFGDSVFDDITGRLRDVLLLMLEEKTNMEIAEALGISESTVRSHKSALMQKVDVPTQQALLAKAREYGFQARYGW